MRIIQRISLAVLLPFIFILSPQLAQGQQLETSIACDEASEPIALSYGEYTTGCTVSPVTDLDQFSFEGSVGDNVRITALSTTTHMDPRLEVRNPSGEVITTPSCNNFGCAFIEDLTLDVTGSYLLALRDGGSNESGGYLLQLERIPPISTPPTLPYVFSVSDSISPRTDLDFLIFEGVAGTDIRLAVLSTTTHMDPRLEVRDPNGVVIATPFCNNFGCSLIEDLTLDITGNYLLALRDGGTNESGGYQINLQCLFGPCPSDNNRPILGSIGNQDIGEGDPVLITVTANDPDDDNLSFTVTDLPTGAQLIDNDDGTSELSWTPNQAGIFPVTFTVVDDGTPPLSDSQEINITVGAPVLDPIGIQTGKEGEELLFSVTATDPEDDNISTEAANLPPGADLINNGDGTAEFSWTPAFGQAGDYHVTFTATDDGVPPLSDRGNHF